MNDFKYLSMISGFKLKLNTHINSSINTFRELFCMFKNLKHYFNIEMERIIYISLVQSIISYSIILCWGHAYKIHLEKLKTSINCIIIFVLNKPMLFY